MILFGLLNATEQHCVLKSVVQNELERQCVCVYTYEIRAVEFAKNSNLLYAE